MKLLISAAICLGLLSGCSFLGYYKREKPERAPPEEASTVQFPDSFEGGVHLTGPMMAALEVAANEFLPPGSEVEGKGVEERVLKCLSRRDTYEVFVLQSSDNLFFVRFSPVLKRCGIDSEILDGGAVYAIDGKGRILEEQ
jgi:hypothetical protein